ncbi:hypothetical protein Tco_0985673 [Tanacetum coccineum]
MRILGYQGSLKKVSAFFTKNLAQPWQTMFKVFNRCLTSRTSGHDQTKINQKKNVIQYPCFTKLIIADLMEKYKSIPKRLEEEFHTIKDDIPLVSVYSIGEVNVRRMLIPNDLLTDAIKDTQAYKDYTKKYEGKKKGKRATGESSSPKPSLKIRIKQQKVTPTTPLPLIEEKLLEEDVEKIVEGIEDLDGNTLADTILLSDEDSGDRSEPGSHKDKLEEIHDDDDDKKKDNKKDDDNDNHEDDHNDNALIITQVMGSSEIRIEKMQTPIPSPPRSPTNDLSLDNAIA